jgi:dipeptidyl aminopeptidase/acylaminoacyl peptidase
VVARWEEDRVHETPGTSGTLRNRREEPNSRNTVATVATPDDAEAVATSGEPIDKIARSPVGLGVRWAADDTLIYFSYRDGWQHLYAIKHPGKDSKPVLLTPGDFMVEQVALTPDRKTVVYNANTDGRGGLRSQTYI